MTAPEEDEGLTPFLEAHPELVSWVVIGVWLVLALVIGRHGGD